MYAILFFKINGRLNRKYFKTFNVAKQYYDSVIRNKFHRWHSISMVKMRPEQIPKNYKIKEEWLI